MQPNITLYIIKLVLAGIAAFLAIALWSKTRDVAWMSLVAGIITGYAALVYELLGTFGITIADTVYICGIPLTTLLFTVVPPVFFILAFILMLARDR